MSRPEHAPVGEPCARCGLAASRHRKRTRERSGYMAEYQRERRKAARVDKPIRVVGIDGEGYTDSEGVHRYVYLAAADADGTLGEVSDPDGLSWPVIRDFLLDLPRGSMLVGYSLGYDITKWIESWSDSAVFALMHPELRPGEHGPRPVRVDGYNVNRVGSLFTLRSRGKRDKRSARVWDVFRYFQCSFVTALERWNIGTPSEREAIQATKVRRSTFAGIGPDERAYCQSECRLLAKLATTLIEACQGEGLASKVWHGPGSSASVLLDRMGAKAHAIDSESADPRLQHALACAFFGGRFESSRVGPVDGPLYAYDIASAYPYAMSLIPCMAHGKWRLRKRWSGNMTAVVRYRLRAAKDCGAWGPLPYRLADGNIVFPRSSPGGWAHAVEIVSAQKLHAGVETLEAWEFERTCDCAPPFTATINELFERRKALGRTDRGLVIKLALNSLYGKSAQSIGQPKHRCMLRAGLITATTRAMLLDAIALARDPWSVLEVATDSVLSTEPLALSRLGTGQLGAWEGAEWADAYLVRPGIRFGGGNVAARGVGRARLAAWEVRLREAWAREPLSAVTLDGASEYWGARASVARLRVEQPSGDSAWAYRRSERYGRWIESSGERIGYEPTPKRAAVLPGYRLACWTLAERGAISAAYGQAPPSPLGVAAQLARELAADD